MALVLLCFVKKLTVIGIIGKIQGVSNAVNPNKNATIKIVHNPFSSSFLFCSSAALALTLASFLSEPTASIAVEVVSEVVVLTISSKLMMGSISPGVSLVVFCVSAITSLPGAGILNINSTKVGG